MGRALLKLAEAEARRAGFASIYLFTHEGLVESRAVSEQIGYVERERRPMKGFSLVFMRKPLTG